MKNSAKSLSLGPVMLDIAGLELTQEDKDLLRHPLVGGVILFTRNYDSPSQLRALTEEIHSIRHPQLLIGVDHEGGRVQRFREGFTQLPPARLFGAIYDKDAREAKQLVENAGWLMAAELRAVGVDISFAPVLDLDRGVSQVIGDRAYHSNPEIVAELAHSFMSGMNRAGMAATGKHFPGHGSVEADSHIDLPVDQRSYQDIYQEDILPFERMIGYGLAAIMPAHVIYPQVAPEPAGFSDVWLRKTLREQLGFQGAIISDDLSMAGAKVIDSVTGRVDAALRAGCDMVLICNDRKAAQKVLDSRKHHDDPVAQVRLARLHGRHAPNREDLMNEDEWAKVSVRIEELSDGQTLELEV